MILANLFITLAGLMFLSFVIGLTVETRRSLKLSESIEIHFVHRDDPRNSEKIEDVKKKFEYRHKDLKNSLIMGIALCIILILFFIAVLYSYKREIMTDLVKGKYDYEETIHETTKKDGSIEVNTTYDFYKVK